MRSDQIPSSRHSTPDPLLQTLSDALIGVWECDHARTQLSWSKGMQDLLGDDALSAPLRSPAWLALIHPDDHSVAEKLFFSTETPDNQISDLFSDAGIRWGIGYGYRLEAGQLVAMTLISD